MNELDFIYFKLDSPTQATGRIRGDIGYEVIASCFVQEFEYLEANGVTEFDIRINSGGGFIFDGFCILAAMLNSKAKITTYNDGLCGSTAGWLFLAGSEAVAADYSWLMVHNPSGSDGTAKGNEIVANYRQSIITIVSRRTGLAPTKVAKMMDEDTWLNADTQVALGFASRKQETGILVELNPSNQSIDQMYRITNSAMPYPLAKKNMEDKTPKTDSTPEVVNQTEDTQPTPAAEAPEVADAPEAATATDVEKEALKLQNEELVKKHDDVLAQLASMQLALNKFEEAEAKKEADAHALKITNLVGDAIKAGKIGEDSRTKFTNLAQKSFESAEMALEAMPASGVRKAVNVMDLAANLRGSAETLPSLREMEKKDKAAVNRLIIENPAYYAQLYENQYGVKWLGGPQAGK